MSIHHKKIRLSAQCCFNQFLTTINQNRSENVSRKQYFVTDYVCTPSKTGAINLTNISYIHMYQLDLLRMDSWWSASSSLIIVYSLAFFNASMAFLLFSSSMCPPGGKFGKTVVGNKSRPFLIKMEEKQQW